MPATDRPNPAAGQVSPYCLAAAVLNVPEAHARCRGAGPLYTPPFRSPVLPAIACDCPCHTKGPR